jgi:hypothetical protein
MALTDTGEKPPGWFAAALCDVAGSASGLVGAALLAGAAEAGAAEAGAAELAPGDTMLDGSADVAGLGEDMSAATVDV